MPQYSLEQLAKDIGAELRGDASHFVSGLADLNKATRSDLGFLSSKKYASVLESTQAGAVILREADLGTYSGNALVVEDPYLAFALLSKKFDARIKTLGGVHPTATISSSAELGRDVSIGPNCVISEGAVIGDGVELCAGVVVGDHVKIGNETLIHPNVVLYHQVELGERVIIHANTTIGSDGFGFAPKAGAWEKIHQLGRVIIGNDVEIGANSAIDRGALEDTVIGDNVIIDNQVHIAHNCSVGDGTAIAGCVGIAGSTHIGKNCLLGGMVAVSGHLDIADGTMFNGATIVTKGNREKGVFASATPIQEAGAWRKNSARFRQLDAMYKRLVSLEKRLEEKDSNSD